MSQRPNGDDSNLKREAISTVSTPSEWSDRKCYTLMLVSNRKDRPISITVSAGWLKAVSVFVLVFSVIGAAAVVDYLGLLGASVENRRLVAENRRLRDQFQVVEGKLNTLESNLERVRGFVTKLRMITNVESEDRSLKLALSSHNPGVDSAGGAETMAIGRAPASINGGVYAGSETPVAESDSIFYAAPKPDAASGEVATQQAKDYATLAIRIDAAVQEVGIREQGALELWTSLSEHQNLLSATPSIKPTRGWFTSKFGYRISPFTGKPVMHNGLDVAAAPGSPIYSPADGVVSFAGYDPGYGKLVSVDHGYGVVTRYGHTSQIYVEVGQKVKRRDVIAAVGTTGRSTGPHLHYEVRINDVPVDPANYILDE